MKFSFVKLAPHRRFHLEPIYYDEAAEERRERERRIRSELGIKSEEQQDGSFEDRVRGKMRRRIKTSFEVSRKTRRISNIRLIIILAVLMMLFYQLLISGYEWYSRFL